MTVRCLSRLLSLALPATLALSVPACVITAPDDDDSAGDSGGNGMNSGAEGDSTGDGGDPPADTDDDPPADTDDGDPPADTDDDPPADTDDGPGNADNPTPGTWIYTETGNTVNDCDFIDDLSNGWGEYVVEEDGSGFLVIPGDGTDAFECTASNGTFECDERLQDQVQSGTSQLQVLVGITGTLQSADQMQGTQNGQIVCEGADCALAEQVLGTTFPCEFTIEFDGNLAG